MTKNERKALEQWREFLAGPCDDKCPSPPPYNGHKHYSAWYENNRSTVVGLNHLLEGWDLSYFARLRELQPTLEEIDAENKEEYA